MKEILKSNIWLAALTVCLFTLLGYTALATKECVELDFSEGRVKAGNCEFTSK